MKYPEIRFPCLLARPTFPPLPNYFFIPSKHEPSEYIRANLSCQEERKAVCRCILPSWTHGTYSLRNSGFSFTPIYPSAASQICSSMRLSSSRLITIEHSQGQNVTKERNTFFPMHIFVQIFLSTLFLAHRIHSKSEFIKSCKTYIARYLHFLLCSFSLSRFRIVSHSFTPSHLFLLPTCSLYLCRYCAAVFYALYAICTLMGIFSRLRDKQINK